MTITEYLGKQRTSVLVALGAVLFALVVSGDYLTHIRYLVEFFPFYLVPVSFFSWFLGKQPGFLCALASLASGFLIRLRPAPQAVSYWDAAVWFALYIGSVLMIRQLKKLYEHERHLSRIDPLTLVENRRAFLESAARAKSFSERHDAPLSIAYLDLDDFKHFNDRMGHTAGDKLLVVVAQTTRRALRPTDVVARIGGDEFAILLPETGEETAAPVLNRVRAELDQEMRNRNWLMTFSIGLVSFSPPVDSVPDMIRAADEVMYAAKHKGKNRVEQRRQIAIGR